MGDVTALFESYHAFSNKSSIKESLDKYRVDGKGDESYDFTSYNELCEPIQKLYKFKRGNIKATHSKHLYVCVLSFTYVLLTRFCLN